MSPLLIALVFAPACSKKEKEGAADQTAETASAGGAEKPADTAGEPPAAAGAARTSFEATVSGGAEGTFSGAMALVYDMAGFGHISLNAKDRSIAIDFNSKKEKRPPQGAISLVRNNLSGWTANVDLETGSGTATYISEGGTLNIESVDGGIVTGSFEFEAKPSPASEVEGGEEIQVKGSFTARDRK